MGCSCIKHNLKESEFQMTEEDEKNNNNPNIDNKENKDNKSNNNPGKSDNINKDNTETEENVIVQNEQIINKQNTENTSSHQEEILLKNNKSTNNNFEEQNIEKKSKKESIDFNPNIKNEINNNSNNNIIENNSIIKKESFFITKNFNKKVFEIINKIRSNPPEYSKFVLDNICNIKIENKEILNPSTEMKEYKQIIVFKKKVKIELYKGESCFLEAAKILKKMSSMKPFEFNEDIVIPIPEVQGQINANYIKNKAKDYNIKAFFKGNVKNPEIAALMMIVDDSKSSEKKKRNSILNKDFKYIGIDSKFIGKNFLAHFSFS